ncbi:hypothetical protein CTheo_3283 [Ceratobasidium theobromae]|uniref:Transmembrane protein n=1 Tax=Ceratobasidium theobromae TaxID=1582974 RepID=A0A5N5QNC8_9AGAM|nr:hypothetical protein CTheo_3283 [Ceratobasidium theobromae]
MSSLLTKYSLHPTLPTDIDRFSPVNWVKVSATPRSAASSCDLSSWDATKRKCTLINPEVALVHPEGAPISFRGKTVSSQQLTETHITLASEILGECESCVAAAAADVTLFLEILGHLASYYVVVHDSKTIVWIAGHRPSSFEDATRAKHDQEYWTHMENFPGPRFSTPEDIRLLKHVLAANAIDALTSDGSTSPMSPEQIQTHLAMLDKFSTEGDVYQTYAIARIWNLILQCRVINNYGTPKARLDRFISITNNPPAFTGGYALLATLMLNTPSAHLGRCSRAWADRIAYSEEWRRFKATNEQEWKQVMYLACVLVIASLLVDKQSSFIFGIPSKTTLLTALASAAIAYYLSNESKNLGNHATDSSMYFSKREENLFGVQKIAITNAAPQALLAWGFILLLITIFNL